MIYTFSGTLHYKYQRKEHSKTVHVNNLWREAVFMTTVTLMIVFCMQTAEEISNMD